MVRVIARSGLKFECDTTAEALALAAAVAGERRPSRPPSCRSISAAPKDDAAVLTKLVHAGEQGLLSRNLFALLGVDHGLRGRSVRGVLEDWARKIGLRTNEQEPPMFAAARIGSSRAWLLTTDGLARAKVLLAGGRTEAA